METTSQQDLATAVQATVDKLLDAPPPFVKFPPCRTKTLRRAYQILSGLGYAKDKWKVRGRGYGGWVKTAHPKAVQYLRHHGDAYVQCLEATLRLIKPC